MERVRFDTGGQAVSGATSSDTNLSFTVNEGGTKLSQGQRQVLCLARTLLSERKLIMDEATSAVVDAETHGAIQVALQTDQADCTVITVAQRLTTIAEFDMVIVPEGGMLAEFGRPADLYRQRGANWKTRVPQPER